MSRSWCSLVIASFVAPAAWAQPAVVATSSVATATVAAAAQEPAPIVAAPSAPAAVPVKLTAEAGLTLHRRSGGTYSALCTAPCEVSLPPGNHQLGLSRSGGDVLAAPAPVTIAPSSTELVGRYSPATAAQIGGAVVVAASLAGAILGIVGTAGSDEGATDYVPMAAGLVGGSFGVAVGVAMMLIGDSATVEAR